jgi:adenine-specific DNA-methyltransferase
VPRLKRFLSDVQQGSVPITIWTHTEVGHNQSAKQELKKIFSDSPTPFDTPKPSTLIERILQLASSKDSIILDSFAGSGTTAHAVLNLNKSDAGNRRFILIEMEDYADSITAERVKRVINGYGDKEGTGGSFDYFELGESIFTENGYLNEEAGIASIRNYIYYTETRSPLNPVNQNTNDYFLGVHDHTAYYLMYEKGAISTLNHSFLSSINIKAESYVVYADNCVLTKNFMLNHRITFKKIPRDIIQF